ncbi:RHS repeat-associated core domain-containing protein [uncultured Thiodictyon sp.]|uniref:RHS repeat-associated core domain-containing protein n=1 Tax=uncultured Thiodictyon sp. TaxID=1846217 RepID=UPI0025CFFBBE|nr:RHS repeat-associated core domain-containing protein [uncultured Thiodictyon sp.]
MTTLVYATNGVDVLSVTDARGSIGYEYNDHHQVIRITDRRGNKTAFAYNNYGQPTQITGAEGSAVQMVTALIYDANQRLVQVTRAGQTLAQVSYDTIGRIRTQTDTAGLTLAYDYDALNQPTRVTYPDGRTEQFAWSTGRPFELTQETSRGGKVNRYTYDPQKRLTASIAPDSGLTRPIYDADGNLTKLLDANSNPTAFAYDADNLVTAQTYADGKGTTYTYDLAGRVKTRTNARAIVTAYTYDRNGNLTGIDYADTTPDVTFVYDAHDRLIQRADGIGVSRFTYDANDNLLSVDGPWANDTITYTYDPLNRRTGMNAQGGTPVAYTYDAFGRLATIAQSTRAYTLTYQGNSNLLARLTRPNGSYTAYTNDGLQRLTAIGNHKSDGTLINSFAYSYNGDDNRTTEIATNGLPMVALAPLLETNQVNSVNQPTNATNPTRIYQYDADGNMIHGYTPAGVDWTAIYDAEDRLTRIEYADSGGIVHVTQYRYFATDLVGQIDRYENTSLVSDIRLVYDGFLSVQERDGGNTAARHFLWLDGPAGGVGALLGTQEPGTLHTQLFDGKGNVVAVTDEAGQVVSAYRYDAYGLRLSSVGDASQPMGFATKRYDDATGLLDFGFRNYSTVSRSWLTRDPIGTQGGANLYEYVTSNPINFVDPFGLSKGGKQNVKDTGLSDLTDEEVADRARDRSLSGEERRRYQKEEKARGQRNKEKRNPINDRNDSQQYCSRPDPNPYLVPILIIGGIIIIGGLIVFTGGTGAIILAPAAASDRRLKRNLQLVDSKELLARVAELDVRSWRYRWESDDIRHIGPMAQDFHAKFGCGRDDRVIDLVDANGVLFAAIQEVQRQIRDHDATIAALGYQTRQQAADLEEIRHVLDETRERQRSLPDRVQQQFGEGCRDERD